ncbi:MAG: hypothetical protein QGF90_01695, partial [Gammaproteobacteria bacterium]|nr:hypothetical protein [Gammaproteobacteria bacterium]
MFLAQRHRPLLAQEEPLLQQVQQYHQNQSGAQQLYRQNMAEQARQQAEYQRRLAADEVGVEPYSLFLGRQTEDPSAGFEFAPADLWPGSAAVKKGLLATAAAIPSLMYWNYARKNPVPPGMLGGPVFHGTPHKWESGVPDLSKVGTGEGAQTYGHGIYFAENPNVAKSYSAKMMDTPHSYKGVPFPPNNVNSIDAPAHVQSAISDLISSGGDIKEAREIAERRLKEWLPNKEIFGDEVAKQQKALASLDEVAKDLEIGRPGNLYKVDIPDADIDRMLDWDKPLSEQPESVQRIVKKTLSELDESDLGYGLTHANAGDMNFPDELMTNQANITGRQFYRVMEYVNGGQAEASFRLADIGIPGIKYLDQG